MKDNGKLAPGVFRNVLLHGLAMAVLPLIAFFLIKAIGFSGITAAVGKKSRERLSKNNAALVAVLLVHVCLVKFVLSAMKEDTSGGAGGFEKVADKDD
jgi:uncharacterized membrane protein (UPF0182 family)